METVYKHDKYIYLYVYIVEKIVVVRLYKNVLIGVRRERLIFIGKGYSQTLSIYIELLNSFRYTSELFNYCNLLKSCMHMIRVL